MKECLNIRTIKISLPTMQAPDLCESLLKPLKTLAKNSAARFRWQYFARIKNTSRLLGMSMVHLKISLTTNGNMNPTNSSKA